jgi:hypothetical protein
MTTVYVSNAYDVSSVVAVVSYCCHGTPLIFFTDLMV